MFGRNASKRSQVFAPVATRCNMREIRSGLPFEQFCTDLDFPRSFDDSECPSYAFRIIEIESYVRPASQGVRGARKVRSC